MRPLLLGCLLLLSTTAALAADAPDTPLLSGDLVAAEAQLTQQLKAEPKNDQLRMTLGFAQFLHGVERLGQALHRHGLLQERLPPVPGFRLPVPKNPNPQPTTYADQRRILQNLLDDLTKAEATLAAIGTDVKLPVHFGRIRLDLDGDGAAGDEERLWKLYIGLNNTGLNGRRRGSIPPELQEQAESFVIAFDTGDVLWLRGYCHLLSATIEFQLAYDGQTWFDHCGHLMFAKAQTPFPFLQQPENPNRPFDRWIFDGIAAIHLLNFPLKEPARMGHAREHLLAVTQLSRQSWDAIVAETDDDREWLPNPRQTSVIGVPVTDKQIAAWREIMQEAQTLLEGEKLLPFWRDSAQGINLKRIFTQPRDFDWMLWIQGTAAAPYLEAGPQTPVRRWREWAGVFGNDFPGFAVWFN